MFGPYRFQFGQPVTDPFQSPYKKLLFDSAEESNSFDHNPQPPVEAQPPATFMDAYRELLKGNNGPSMERYRKFLESGAPRREDYKPGVANRIAAILSGISSSFSGNPQNAASITSSMLEAPYRRRLEDYSQEGGRLKELAEVESLDQKNKLQVVNSLVEAKNKEEDNKRAERALEQQLKKGDLDMKRTQQLIESHGMQFVINRETGEGSYIKPDGTIKKIGKFDLSNEQRIKQDQSKEVFSENLRRGTAFSLEAQRHKNRLAEEDNRQEGRETLLDDKQAHQLTRDAARGGITGSSRTDSINQTLLRNRTTVQSIVDGNPDKYDDVWKINPQTGYHELNKDKKDTPEYKELYKALYANIELKKPGEKKPEEKKIGSFGVSRGS